MKNGRKRRSALRSFLKDEGDIFRENLLGRSVRLCSFSIGSSIGRLWFGKLSAAGYISKRHFATVGSAIQHRAFSLRIDRVGRIWNRHHLWSADVSRDGFCADDSRGPSPQYSRCRNAAEYDVPHACPRRMVGWLVGRSRPHIYDRDLANGSASAPVDDSDA